jgi:ABC-2 type transport system permease protein
MNRIWTIARREVKALFDQPTGYVLLVVFIGINAFLFFRNAFLTGSATLRPMLDLIPWVFLFFVPAVAMRSLAEDNRAGLLEIVLSQPISEAELVLGKYLGVLLALLFALGTTLFIPLGLRLGSDLPLGPVVAQYLGAALLAAGFGGIGVWASSVTRSQITAFILAVLVMFLLILAGLDPLLVGLPPLLGAAAARLGVLSHFDSIGRGVLDLRDLLYFLSLAAVFLVLAHAAVMRRKLAHRSESWRRLQAGTLLLIAVLIAVNLAGGQIGGRIDLTPGHAYTLSRATRETARGLSDLVTIKLFASKELPPEFALVKRDVDDLLRDLRSAGHGKIRVIERDPAGSAEAQQDARALGIVPVQFNVVGQASLQVKEGYLGLAMQFADKTEAIPVIQRTDDLEYRLVSALRNMTRTKKPVVVVEADAQAGGFGTLQQELAKSYTVRSVSPGDTTALGGDVAALVVASARDSAPAAAMERVKAFLAQGGKALVMEGGMAVSPETPMASARPVAWNAVLRPYGVQIRQDMVYDLRANQVISVPTSIGMRLLRPYPYFLRAQSTRQSAIVAELPEVSLAWTSSIDTTGAPAGTVTPLLVTSNAAGVSTGTVMIEPSQEYPTTGLGVRLLAVQVAPRADAKSPRPGPRLVVVGNGVFASDDFLKRTPENLDFALNAVDWLAQDESLIAIRAKDRRPPPLVFKSAALRDTVKYLNIAGIPLVIAALGGLHLVGRRRRTTLPYRPLAGRREAA